MIQVANQFVRIFSDDGRGDEDFGEAEERLRQSQSNLLKATDLLKHTAELLSGLLESRENRKH